MGPCSRGGVSTRIRAGDLAAVFEVYILAVALGALKTAVDTSSPWFRETETLWAYATTFLASSVLVCILVLAGGLLTRPGASSSPRGASSASNRGRTMPDAVRGPDADMERLLESLDQAARAGNPSAAAVATVQERVEVQAIPASEEATEVQRARVRRVRMALMGPSIAATVFAGVSAALLPGAGGFLQTNYTINTFLVLTFAYSWGGLIAYVVASLFLASANA